MGAIADEAEALAVSDTVPQDNSANSTPCGFLNEEAYGYVLTDRVKKSIPPTTEGAVTPGKFVKQCA